MNRLNLTQSFYAFGLAVGAIAVAACFPAGAQTTTETTPVKKPTPIRAAKTATPRAVSQKTQTAAPIVTPASSQTVLTPSTPVSTTAPSNMLNGVTAAGSTAASNAVTGLSSAGSNAVTRLATPGSTASPSSPGQTYAGGSNNAVAGGDPRAPVGGMGVGSFVFQGWTLTSYGCFRTGTRLFCDFDTSHRSNLQAGSNIWGPVKLVDDGGKITDRHNAFFVGDDGSQFATAYLTSGKPARFIIEFDDVGQRYTSISLVLGKEQIQAIPITLMDPSTPAGTLPARASAGTRSATR
jgi:hypothetical protein